MIGAGRLLNIIWSDDSHRMCGRACSTIDPVTSGRDCTRVNETVSQLIDRQERCKLVPLF